MPNHIHGIVELVGTENFPSNDGNNNIMEMDENENNRSNNYSTLRSPSKTIGSVVRGFKIGVTKWFRQQTDIEIVWQRNYYEHIIRNEQSHQNISKYIANNPAKCYEDKFHK